MKSLAHFCDIVSTFTIFDDLVKILNTSRRPGRKPDLNVSEVLTIITIMVKNHIKEMSILYTYLQEHHSKDFTLPCYKNFVQTLNNTTPFVLLTITILLKMNNPDNKTVLVDATALPVCKNIRITNHKVSKGLATRSKGTMGWFYGFKLHLATNTKGDILKLRITTGNAKERDVLKTFLQEIHECFFVADAGYISQELEQFAYQERNLLKTCTRKNMKKLMTQLDHYLLNQRIRIESVFSVLKDRLNLVSSLARSVKGCFSHYVRIIFGYIALKSIS